MIKAEERRQLVASQAERHQGLFKTFINRKITLGHSLFVFIKICFKDQLHSGWISSLYCQVAAATCSVHTVCSKALHSALLCNTTSLLDAVTGATDNFGPHPTVMQGLNSGMTVLQQSKVMQHHISFKKDILKMFFQDNN